MAVSISTITKAAGWARTDVILALEEAFAIVNFHGDTRTGIVTFIDSYSGGGSISGNSDTYEDVFPVTTTGIGTGASFRVTRSNGPVNAIYVNRPGYGYTDGEYVTLSAEDIGGSANGAVAIGITVKVSGNETPTGYGSTTTFYTKDVTAGATYPWGVLRHEIEPNKKFGNTYRVFQTYDDYTLSFGVGSDFHPWGIANVNNKYSGYPNRWAGTSGLDSINYSPYGQNLVTTQYMGYYDRTFVGSLNGTGGSGDYNQTGKVNGSGSGQRIRYATTNSPKTHDLKLKVYRSSLDPKFAVFSFSQPTVTASSITDNTFLTFILHNYDSNLWDLDDVFLSGLTLIETETCSAFAGGNPGRLQFTTFLGGNTAWSGSYRYNISRSSWRTAEAGYGTYESRNMAFHIYESTSSLYGNEQNTGSSGGFGSIESNGYPAATKIYTRRTDAKSSNGYSTYINSNNNYNAVIKGLPLNGNLVPCPYYLPDDFVMIDFKYSQSATNIQQGDTVTISGSEVYEVITGSYNQYADTSGLLFCARVV